MTISSECNTQWFILVFRVCNSFSHYRVSLASFIHSFIHSFIQKDRKKSEDRLFARLPTCQSGTSAMLSGLTVPLSIEALGNAWYGSWRPLNNLTQTFQACHLCTFNIAAIFFRSHPYIWRITLRHDIAWNLHFGANWYTSLVPRPPSFLVLRFAFSIIHGSRRMLCLPLPCIS